MRLKNDPTMHLTVTIWIIFELITPSISIAFIPISRTASEKSEEVLKLTNELQTSNNDTAETYDQYEDIEPLENRTYTEPRTFSSPSTTSSENLIEVNFDDEDSSNGLEDLDSDFETPNTISQTRTTPLNPYNDLEEESTPEISESVQQLTEPNTNNISKTFPNEIVKTTVTTDDYTTDVIAITEDDFLTPAAKTAKINAKSLSSSNCVIRANILILLISISLLYM